MERSIRRENREEGRWCELEVRLSAGRLSITGSEGAIVPVKEARKMAIAYWGAFFEDSPDEIAAMEKRMGLKKRFRTAHSAALYVVRTDGEFHGLDVHAEEGDVVYLTENCGQIIEALREWFPEVVPYLGWHLNDMKAGCEHQEELGWGRGRDVALDATTMTQAQRDALYARNLAVASRAREKRHGELKGDASLLPKLLGRRPTVFEQESFVGKWGGDPRVGPERRKLDKLLRDHIDQEIPVATPGAEIFRDSIGAPCPECGVRYGEQWLKRELPAEVLAWFEALAA